MSALLVVVAVSAITLPSVTAQGQPEVLRARGLIVVDEQGRERIVIGSPVPDPREGKRLNPSTGMVITASASTSWPTRMAAPISGS